MADQTRSSAPTHAGTPAARPPLARLDDFYQDGEYLLFQADGKTHRIHRVAPLARAYARLRDVAVSVRWEGAVSKAQAAGIPLPKATATIFEEEKKPGLLKRLFGRKNSPEKEEPTVAPAVPDYAATGAAIGIPANLTLKGIEVTDAGAEITFSDDTKLKVEAKSELARETIHLLEELDAIGVEKLTALAKLNSDLGRPMVRLAPFAPPGGQRQGLPMNVLEGSVDMPSDSLAGQDIYGGGPGEADGALPEPDLADLEGALPPELATESPASSELADQPRIDQVADSGDAGSDPVEVSSDFIAALAKEGDALIEQEKAQKEADAANALPADLDGPPQESPADSGSGKDGSSSDAAAASEPPDAAGNAANEERHNQDEPAPAEPDMDAPTASVEVTPRGAPQRAEHWSDHHVRLAQTRLPKPDGPFTLAAKGEQMVDGKFPVFGEINVSKADYEVIKWLARSRREARYKVEIEPTQDGPDGPSGAPNASIVGLQLQNESQVFTPIDWKKCREEFEAANKKVQLPTERDSQKSAAVQTQLATGALPGDVKPAAPKEGDLKRDPLPLPTLRPISVPKAGPSQGGPSLGR